MKDWIWSDYLPGWSAAGFLGHQLLKNHGKFTIGWPQKNMSNYSFNPNITVPLDMSFGYSSNTQLLGSSYTGRVLKKITYGNKRKVRQAKYPLVEKIEIGGTTSDPDVVYLSMGPNFQRIADSVAKIVIYALFNKAGFEFSNFDKKIGRVFRVDTKFYDTYTQVSPATLSQFTVSSNATTTTYADLASLWLTQLISSSTTIATDLTSIQLFESSDVSDTDLIGEIDPKKLIIKGVLAYALLFQNQSLGGSAGATSSDSVTNNPLHVTHYQVLGNMYTEKQRSDGVLVGTDVRPATYKAFAHWGTTDYKDLIVRTAAAQWTTPQYQAGKIFTNTKKANTFIMNPGQMKKTTMNIVEAHSLSRWIGVLHYFFVSSNPSLRPVRFGGSRMLIFDKMINSGEDVSVSYELNIKSSWGYHLNSKEMVMPQFIQETI